MAGSEYKGLDDLSRVAALAERYGSIEKVARLETWDDQKKQAVKAAKVPTKRARSARFADRDREDYTYGL